MDLANKNLLNVNSFSDVSVVDLAQLGLAFKSGNLPLKISFNIEAQNPNEKLAALEKLDWILEVDKTDYLKGTTNERFEIAPNGGVNTLPITTSLDIREALGKESIKSIINLVAAVKGDNQEQSRIRLKIKPRFKIAGITMAYPGFIKLGKTFEESKIEGEQILRKNKKAQSEMIGLFY